MVSKRDKNNNSNKNTKNIVESDQRVGSYQEELVHCLIGYHKGSHAGGSASSFCSGEMEGSNSGLDITVDDPDKSLSSESNKRARRRLDFYNKVNNMRVNQGKSKKSVFDKSPMKKNFTGTRSEKSTKVYNLKIDKSLPSHINQKKLTKVAKLNKSKTVKKSNKKSAKVGIMKQIRSNGQANCNMSRTNISELIEKNNKVMSKVLLYKIMDFQDIYQLMIENNVKTVNIPENIYNVFKKGSHNTQPKSLTKIHSIDNKVLKKNDRAKKKSLNYYTITS